MAIELAHAYVSILPETKAIAPGVAKALTGVEKTADKSGKSMGQKLSSGMGSVLKKSAVGVGAAAGAALGAGLTKGVGRLNSIEQAEAKLKGLGHSAQSVGGIMENSLAAVKGTAFGLEEAATTAAGVVAAGIKPGKELEQVLKTVGDTATIAGTSMSEMGTIFGSVAARGKLQGDDMLQLMSRGVPVLQLLGDELGKTSAEISDMVSAGDIDFKTFERAMRRGVGGSALEAGNTVQGAMRNMGAAAGRLGATISGPFFKRAAGGFNGVTAALDAMDARMKPVMANVDKWLTGTAAPAFERFGRSAASAFESFKNSGTVVRTADVFKSLGQTAMNLAPTLINIGSAVAQASAALGIGTWNMFLTALQAVGAAADALTPALEAISSVMSAHPSLVLAAVAAWQGFRPVPGFMQTATDAVKKHAGGLKDLRAGVSDIQAYYKASGQEIGKFSAAMQLAGTSSNKALQAMGQGYSQASAGLQKVAATHRQAAAAAKTNALQSKSAFTAIDFMGQQAAHSFVASTASMGAAAKGLVGGGLNVMKAGARGVIGAFGGPWGAALTGATFAISTLMAESAKAKEVQEQLAGKSREVASAHQELALAVDAATGKLGEQGVAAAAKLAKAQMTEFLAVGEQTSSWLYQWHILAADTNAEVASSARQTGAAYNELKDTAGELGYSMEDVNRIAATGGPEFSKLQAALRASGDDGARAADELDKVREAVQRSIDKARELGPAGQVAADALKDIADQAGTAGDRANKLNRAFMELAGVEVTAAEANANLTTVIESVSQQMDNLAGATLSASGAFDTTTTSGVAAHNAVMDIGQAMRDAVAAGEPAAAVFARSEESLKKLAEQSNMTEGEYQAMLDSYRLTPELLETTVALSTDEATASLEVIRQQFADFDGEPVTKTIQVHDQEAVNKLNSLGIRVTEFDEATGTAKATVDDQEALTKLDNLIQSKVPELSQQVARPQAHLDATNLFATKELAAQQLMTIDRARPMPWASMDISSLHANQIAALNEVGLLDGQTPTPDAYMNIENLSAEQQAALSKVYDLDSETPTPWASLTKTELENKANDASKRLEALARQKTEPVVTAETKQAISALGGVDSLLKGLKSKTIDVVVNRINRVLNNSEGGRFASGGRFADGGKLPAYARGDRHDGYRIPNTGPGSHGTDEWLAVDQYNQPVARLDHGEWIINRRSSARYDKELAAINAGTFPKLPGYADGGVFDDLKGGRPLRTAEEFLRFARGEMVDGEQASRSLDYAPYNNFPSNPMDWGDCSYTAGKFAAFGLGLPTSGRHFSTVSQLSWLRSHGAQIGDGPEGSLRIGWYDNGGGQFGHTSSTLPDGTNVEMGGGNGGGAIGRGAVPWNHSQFTHHAWIPAANSGGAGEPGSDDYSQYYVPIDGAGGSSSYSGSTSSSEYDANMVPLSGDGASAAERLDSADPGLLGGASTWSDFGGSVVAAAVSGQIADVLSVFGIPNELPPVVKAGQQWYQAAKEANQKTADFMNAEADLIRAADAVEEAQANPDAVTDAVDATVEVDATSTAADAVSEVAEPAPDVPEWGEGFFAHEIARAAIDSGFNHEGEAYDAAQIALATALVESGSPMKMYANNAVPESLEYRHDAVGSDHDSVGLFQQRDNGAWGTVAQRMDPYESAKLFFDALKKVDWQNMEPGAAAQAVQRSAFPGRYSVQLDKAGNLAFETGLFVYNAQANRNDVKKAPAFKKGGMVAGGAGKNLDDVLAWLSNGEMVINSDSVDADPGMAQTLNEQGPDAVKAQVLSEYAPVSPNASVEPEKRVVQTFDVDPGSLQNTINGALPMLMAQNSWADAAKLVTSSAVSFAGNMATSAASGAVDMVAEAGMSALGMAGAPTLGAMVGAATAPVTGALGPAAGAMAGTAAAPFGSLLGQVMPLTPGDMVGAAGGVMTDAAAWYAGEVAWGVTNAFEQYSKDLFGTVLLPFQDVMGVLKSPVVGDLAAQAGIDIPGGRSFADMVPEPVRTAASELGNVYNFYATNREGMYSDFRRELAKDSKGLIGAR